MVNATTGEGEACLQIVRLQVGHLLENLCGIQAGREKVENVDDANAHPAHTRTATALLWVERDAIE